MGAAVGITCTVTAIFFSSPLQNQMTLQNYCTVAVVHHMAKLLSAFHTNAVFSIRVHVMAKAWPHCISCRIPFTTSWSCCLSTMTCSSMSGLQHSNKMCFLAAMNASVPQHSLTLTFNAKLLSISANAMCNIGSNRGHAIITVQVSACKQAAYNSQSLPVLLQQPKSCWWVQLARAPPRHAGACP